MIGIGKHSFTASALMIGAMALGGCGTGADAPGTVHLGLVSAGGVTAQSLTIDAQHKQASKLVSAIVTVKEIDAHVKAGDWKPIMTTPISVDLLNLDQQNMTALGIGALPQGSFDKLKLIVDDKGAFVVDDKGNKSVLEVPDSGVVKVIGQLNLDSCGAGTLILDFDPKITTSSKDECGDHSSCDKNGNKDEHYVLRCRATIKTEEVKGQCTGGTTPPPTGTTCGNAGTQCKPTEICYNNNCVDPCLLLPMPCANGTVCIKGQCVSNDACE